MASLAGKFLIARPMLRDPSFIQTVVLVMQHGSTGAFGLVVNRPGRMEGLPFPVYAGGPCESQGVLMLHGHPEWLNESAEGNGEVAPGIFLGDTDCWKRVSEGSSAQGLRFRLFSGSAGWGPGQLEGEVAAGAWAIVPANGELLFDAPAEDLWQSLLPPRIPEPSLN